jgi:hypothetical protein
MNDLRNFFLMLADFEHMRRTQLVSKWCPREVACITRACRSAFKRCHFAQVRFPVPRRISAPALGNRVADAFAERINQRLHGYLMKDIEGIGYPDKALLKLPCLRACALEIKAKTSWDPDNWHRCVLTSCSTKLRRHFKRVTVCHLLATVFFETHCNRAQIRGLRLDFLQPTSIVQARFEASVSQHSLAQGRHPVSMVRAGMGSKRGRRSISPHPINGARKKESTK